MLPSLAGRFVKQTYLSAMKFSHIVAVLSAPLAVAALPAAAPEANAVASAEQDVSSTLLEARQNRRPTPCVRKTDPAPTQEETDARFAEFVEVFVGSRKNISRAFEFIVDDYIVSFLDMHRGISAKT